MNTIEDLYQAALHHHQAGQYHEAAEKYLKILRHYPRHPSTLHFLGIAKAELGDFYQAYFYISRAIELDPGQSGYFLNRGNVQWHLKRPEAALKDFSAALELDPDNLQALERIAHAEQFLGDFGKSYAAFARLNELRPNDPHVKLSLVMLAFKLNLNEAPHLLQELLSLELQQVSGFPSLIRELLSRGSPGLALKVIQKGLSVEPRSLELLVLWAHVNQRHCYWDHLNESIVSLSDEIGRAIETGDPIPVFNYLSIGLSAKEQFKVARALASRLFKGGQVAGKLRIPRTQDRRDGRMRIGYVSGDFRNHAMSHLIGRMFEHHDREHFEIFAYSIGPDDGSGYREIIKSGVDHFSDLMNCNDEESAKRICSDRIDILVDLGGYTEYARPGIFQFRPAPVQVSYLGLPGTMGADFFDYIIVDRTVVPEDEKAFYSEKVAYMPHCYFVTDDKQDIAPVPEKVSTGLPPDSFVWCCFNRSYKLTPEMFGIWASLLGEISDSVLWLYCEDDTARANLVAHAAAMGVDAGRLIFASEVPKAEHLARMRHADIFLDCFPVTAHTTAVDALWAGIPVITIYGDSLTSRVSASILKAAGLPELIAHDKAEYRNLALQYARDRQRLSELKDRIFRSRKKVPLFDTALFASDMEKLYKAMWDEYCENSR